MSFTDATVTRSTIVWTPRFLLLFGALLVLGLSFASILTQLWLNGLLRSEIFHLCYTAFALASSLLIVFRARNVWIRTGGILAFMWSLLMGLHFVFPNVSQLDPHTALVSHLDIATQSAFLGAATCFTIPSLSRRRWDSWFFRLLPLVGAGIVGFNVLLAPRELPAGGFNESMIVAALLYLGVIIWWFRPANWSLRPGLTFLAGVIPLLQICFTGSGYHGNDVSFFITLVFLLLFSLINLRILQEEQSLFRIEHQDNIP
jgi:hypothetical protein